MPNITISIDEDLLKAGRKYAKMQNISLNALIRKVLSQVVGGSSTNWTEKCFHLMDTANANSHGLKWKREDLYDF